jgi:hypothetical protein
MTAWVRIRISEVIFATTRVRPKSAYAVQEGGDTDWIVIDADGSYHGQKYGCRAVKVTIIDRGVVIKGQPGANAVYGLDARCEGEGDTWRERARIEVERWGAR